MPSRTSSHELEEQSRLAFRSLLPRGWVFRDKIPDYGIDGEVETFDQNGKATGDQFLVQLKAKEHTSKSPALSLNIEWISYYLSLELPVLIVLWVKESNRAFWTWATEIDLYYAKPKAKSFTVHFSNVWNNETPAQLQQHLQLRRRLKSQQTLEPLRVVVHAPGRSGIRVHLQTLLARAPRMLVYDEHARDITCTLTKDELRISFGGLRGNVFHSVGKEDDESVARRIVIGVAISLDNFGALNQAAELWASVPNLDKGVTFFDVAWRVISLLTRAGAYTELGALVTALTQRFGKAVLTAPLYTLHSSAPLHRRAQLTDLLAAFELEDFKNQPPKAKSVASYNLARLYEDTFPRKAMRHYAEAIRFSSFYFDRDYFWGELGGFLFSHHRYAVALRCYRYAYEKLGRTERRSHYGDALMHTGQYLEALHVFRSIIKEGERRREREGVTNDLSLTLDTADAALKVRVLEHITQVHGMESQKRQTRLAEAAVGNLQGVSTLDMLTRTETAMRADALSNHAWFNRGLGLQRLGRNKEALESFLVAAAVRTPDDEAWLNVLFLSANYSPDLMSSLLIYLPRQRGADFVRYISEAAQRESDEVRQHVLLDLAKMFTEHMPTPEDAIVRIYGKDRLTRILRLPTK